jgi:hypothetical protein
LPLLAESARSAVPGAFASGMLRCGAAFYTLRIPDLSAMRTHRAFGPTNRFKHCSRLIFIAKLFKKTCKVESAVTVECAHGSSALVFCGESRTISNEVGIAASPACRFALAEAATDAGTLLSGGGSGISVPALPVLKTGVLAQLDDTAKWGIHSLQAMNALRSLRNNRWVSHWHSPFSLISGHERNQVTS